MTISPNLCIIKNNELWRCTINTILFDLDGTLLSLDQDDFIQTYFYLIGKRFERLGYDKKTFVKAVWAGTEAMIKNTGEVTNEVKFWEVFSAIIKDNHLQIQNEFVEFYEMDYDYVKTTTKMNELAKKCVELLKEKGYKLILTTNPVFPKIATIKRIQWSGLDPNDFELITTYENSSFCKPNLKYYQSVLKTINKTPEECMMIGNDVKEDMCVVDLNIKTYLLTENLINPDSLDLTNLPQGNFEDLYSYINNLPKLN